MENSIDKLNQLMDRKPFRVPEGYFENFTERMMRQLPEKQTLPGGKKVNLFERLRPWLAIASVFIGIVILFFVYTKKAENIYADKEMIVKNISLQTVSKLNKDSDSRVDFFDYLSEEYSNGNAEEFIDNLTK